MVIKLWNIEVKKKIQSTNGEKKIRQHTNIFSNQNDIRLTMVIIGIQKMIKIMQVCLRSFRENDFQLRILCLAKQSIKYEVNQRHLRQLNSPKCDLLWTLVQDAPPSKQGYKKRGIMGIQEMEDSNFSSHTKEIPFNPREEMSKITVK